MKGRFFSLLAGALVLLATAQPQTARAQTFCFLAGTFEWTLTVNPATGFLTGTFFDPAGNTKDVVGGRGQDGRTKRHHHLIAIDPTLSDDPGCGAGSGFVDWLSYNGTVSGSGLPYTFSGDVINSCGFVGTFSGTITGGACPAPRQAAPPVANSPNTPGAPGSEAVGAAARTTPEGYALTSSPNPFEAGAVIAYTLPEAAAVRLTVYDALGRQVAVLVDETREAGTHTVTFDGASLPSGTYLAHIVTGAYTEARQMTLTR